MSADPTRRFSSRVENYIKYRPGYPPQVLDLLAAECGLTPASVVADIGSGTGIFSELLLGNGNMVFGVEPNDGMRAAAERLFLGNERFVSVNGTAEDTGLAARSVNLVTAAQAFHWFDRVRAHVEFARILRPGGWLALIWNDRRVDGTAFLREYEELLRAFGTDYAEVRHKYLDLGRVREFAGSAAVKQTMLENRQVFDYDGVKGRLLSSSYAPEPGEPGHDAMMELLATIFGRHQNAGTVAFEYDTHVYCLQLGGS